MISPDKRTQEQVFADALREHDDLKTCRTLPLPRFRSNAPRLCVITSYLSSLALALSHIGPSLPASIKSVYRGILYYLGKHFAQRSVAIRFEPDIKSV